MSTYDGLRFVYLMAQRGLVPGLGVGFLDYPIAPGLLSPWDFPLENEVTTPRQPLPVQIDICKDVPSCDVMRSRGLSDDDMWATLQAYSDSCEKAEETIAPCLLVNRPAPILLRGPKSTFTFYHFVEAVGDFLPLEGSVYLPEWKDRTWILGGGGSLLTLRHYVGKSGSPDPITGVECDVSGALWTYIPPAGAPVRLPTDLITRSLVTGLGPPGRGNDCAPVGPFPCDKVPGYAFHIAQIRADFGCV